MDSVQALTLLGLGGADGHREDADGDGGHAREVHVSSPL
jgi:hypothetical protein